MSAPKSAVRAHSPGRASETAEASGDTAAPIISLLELTAAFTTYGADLDLASGTLRQCSVEILVVLEAMFNGCAPELAYTTLRGIAQRMEVAARLASDDSAW